MDIMEAKEKFAQTLMRQDETGPYTAAVLYMVYRTIEANGNITLNQLRWSLGVEFLLKDETIEGAVASLTSKSLFDCVVRWQSPTKKDDKVRPQTPRVHLRARPKPHPEFDKWLVDLMVKQPELAVFTPPPFNANRTSVKEVRPVKEAQNQTA